MSKLKFTIIDQNTGLVASEIVESNVFPYVGFPQHGIGSGAYGTPLKVELILDASEENTYDTTSDL
jgi:hypothetical protein